MGRYLIIWLAHLSATVAGWYAFGAVAQGVADAQADPAPVLYVFYGIIQLLAFPLVLTAAWIWPMQVGGFRIASFLLFIVLAGINSALVAAVIVRILRTLRHRNADAT